MAWIKEETTSQYGDILGYVDKKEKREQGKSVKGCMWPREEEKEEREKKKGRRGRRHESSEPKTTTADPLNPNRRACRLALSIHQQLCTICAR
jgi:hypothetical protein